VSAIDENGRNIHLVLPLDTLGLALGGGAASRAVGRSRAADRGERNGRGADLGSSSRGGGFDQTLLVEVLEPILGDVGVILHQLALDFLLDEGLFLDLIDGVRKDGGLRGSSQ
jgi:hypothetical protein